MEVYSLPCLKKKKKIYILDLTGDHVTTRSIHHTEFYLTLELIFILFTLNSHAF